MFSSCDVGAEGAWYNYSLEQRMNAAYRVHERFVRFRDNHDGSGFGCCFNARLSRICVLRTENYLCRVCRE